MQDSEYPFHNKPTWTTGMRDTLKRQRPSNQEATVSDWWRGIAGIARSIVESPMNVGNSGSSGLALFSATRISIRL